MRETFLPFCRPSISEEEIAAVADVLRSGWITTGPNSIAFEESFAQRVGAAGAVAVSSATGGMEVVLRALGVGPGDEVITPSMTWVSTVNLICLAGATPVFVDVDRETLMTTAERIAEKITDRTKLIIPVHYAGAPCDMDPIRQLAEEKGIGIVEDAAHSAGTEYKGRPVGQVGRSIFSFHPIKNMTTGEGGMVCSDDLDFLEIVKQLKFHGLGVDAFDRKMQGRSPQAEVLRPGYKYNLTDFASVLGIGQLKRLDGFNARRAECMSLYHEKLAGIEELSPLGVPAYDHKHAWHLNIVRVLDTAKVSRDEFMAGLKTRNIGTGLHFKAVHLHKYYREAMGTGYGLLPDTEWNSDRICSLPLFPEMTETDIDDVIDAIKEVLA